MMESSRGASYNIQPRFSQIPSSVESPPVAQGKGWFSWRWNLREAYHTQPRFLQIPSSAESSCCSGHRLMESARGASYTDATVNSCGARRYSRYTQPDIITKISYGVQGQPSSQPRASLCKERSFPSASGWFYIAGRGKSRGLIHTVVH